jgi:hypothetical protein
MPHIYDFSNPAPTDANTLTSCASPALYIDSNYNNLHDIEPSNFTDTKIYTATSRTTSPTSRSSLYQAGHH